MVRASGIAAFAACIALLAASTCVGMNYRTIRLDDQHAKAIAFSPDGKLLAMGLSRDVLLVDVATGKTVKKLSCPDPLFNHFGFGGRSIAFSPDGKRLAVGGEWLHLVTLKPEPTIVRLAAGRKVWSVAFSSDGCRLVACTNRGVVSMWDSASGANVVRQAKILNAKVPHPFTFCGLCDSRLVIGGGSRALACDMKQNSFSAPNFSRTGGMTWDIESSLDGRLVAFSVLARGNAFISVRESKKLGEVSLIPTASSVWSVSFHPRSNRFLAFGGVAGTVNIADLQTQTSTVIYQPAVHNGAQDVSAVAFSPDGKLLVSCHQENAVRIFETVDFLPQVLRETAEVQGAGP